MKIMFLFALFSIVTSILCGGYAFISINNITTIRIDPTKSIRASIYSLCVAVLSIVFCLKFVITGSLNEAVIALFLFAMVIKLLFSFIKNSYQET